jgi:hypothetical protein
MSDNKPEQDAKISETIKDFFKENSAALRTGMRTALMAGVFTLMLSMGQNVQAQENGQPTPKKLTTAELSTKYVQLKSATKTDIDTVIREKMNAVGIPIVEQGREIMPTFYQDMKRNADTILSSCAARGASPEEAVAYVNKVLNIVKKGKGKNAETLIVIMEDR